MNDAELADALVADEVDRFPTMTYQAILDALPEGTKLIVYADPYAQGEYYVASLDDRDFLEEVDWNIGLDPGQEIQIFPVDLHDPVVFTVPATAEEDD